MPKFRVTMVRSYAIDGDLKPMRVLQALAVRDVFSVQGRTERRTWEFDATDEDEVRSLLKQAGDHPNVRGFDLESITVIDGVKGEGNG